MTQLTLGVCFLAACYYWFSWWDIGMIGNIVTNCTFIGFVFGLFFGDVTTGIIIGATINSMYLTTVAAGGNLGSDASLACCIAIPLAFSMNLSAEAAVAFAIPFAVLGTFLDNIRRSVNAFWNKPVQNAAEAGNTKGIFLYSVLGPIAFGFLVRVPVVTVVLYALGKGAESVLQSIPAWVMTGFADVGKVLPGIGMVLCATLIGRTKMLPFFIIGFFIYAATGMTSVLVICIFAVCIAIIYVYLAFPAGLEPAEQPETASAVNVLEHEGALSKSMQVKTAIRVLFLHRFSNNMQSQFGPSLCYALTPALKEIYKNDVDGLKDALTRHVQPYISEMTWGNCIMGAALAMEEQKCAGAPISGSDISAVKVGLMGPFAGFGDSFNWATVAPIIRSLFLPFGMSGSFIGVLMEPVVRIYAVVLGTITFRLGYQKGRSALTQILRGGWLEKIMTGAGVLGMFMIGAMCAKYTTLTTPLILELSTGTFVLQDRLNSILPGLIPFAIVMGAYAFLRKGGNYMKLILIVFVACLVGAFFGIL